MTQEKMDATMSLITPTLSYGDLADVDIVIEAVFEEMDLKKAVFGELDRICRKDAIMATNTSTLDVNEIAAAPRARSDRAAFFSPANIHAAAGDRAGREDVEGGHCDGLCAEQDNPEGGCLWGVRRLHREPMVHLHIREALFLLEEATPKQVDDAIHQFGI